MTLREFHNGLRILLNIDMHELVEAEVIKETDLNDWYMFRADPFRWFIKAPDAVADKLWGVMGKRMKYERRLRD